LVTHPYPYSDLPFPVKYLGTTFSQATPAASNTTQYPNPVHASDPHCCPRTHNKAPKQNCPIAIREEGVVNKGASGGGVNGGVGMDDVIIGVIGCHGEEGKVEDVGVGVGAPELKLDALEASGSMKEKKLWDKECLW